ncbi:MAG: zinc-ribbon domain-containing protein [Planctomycetes bacterium]|nr:zinc-ribbon domain-containing protein [Planctomycetota bacterium]
MPITVVCSVCNAPYTLRDEYAGRRVKCPSCQNLLDVPELSAVPVPVADPSEADFSDDLPEEFRRDKFLLRQKLWAIKEKYRVADEEGEPILYVERPVYFTQGCIAIVAGIPIIIGAIVLAAFVADQMKGEAGGIAAVVVGGIGALIGLAVIIALYPKRHVQFYTDESKRTLVLEAKQDQKIAFINFWYTLTDENGEVLVRFRKNFVHGILRKRWFIHAPNGEILFEVKEDSIILSLLRRTVGSIVDEIPLLGLVIAAALRTNFIFTRYGETKVLGEFNRRLTLLDRYVLDLSDDPGREIDRRVAVAMGVLLDTGERR